MDGSTVSTTYKSDGSTSDDKFHGFNLENYVIKVTGGVDAEPDLSPPELKSISINDPEIGSNEQVTLAYEAEDLGSGISNIYFTFSNASGDILQVSDIESDGMSTSRNTQNLPLGLYKLDRVGVNDGSPNNNAIHYLPDGTTNTYLGFSEPVKGSHNFNFSDYFFEITGEPVPVPTLDFQDTSLNSVSLKIIKLWLEKIILLNTRFSRYT